ncbi:MAG: SocA family protein [Desulfurococcales archaeon]|nr:SocA family protein [Desulfurococcales archaeon]
MPSSDGAVGVRETVAYILSRSGCLHPFRLSRLLALAESRYIKLYGARLTDAVYVMGPGVFYIEGLKEVFESDECFVKHEGDPSRGVRGCIEYKCQAPRLPENARQVIDAVIEEYGPLDDMELNRLVIEDEALKGVMKG